ncbi:hypothetical protein QR680_016825 [Steinernema hermaphroditum]|uniref:Uncharacterized protein n=1 Tax=Steinernema hermaphroditum TaxID=289476 RepID=A0AA39HCE0_9BILA|nr:hypothetical protein QR680_016825 [Steinernema hermaphroditum]
MWQINVSRPELCHSEQFRTLSATSFSHFIKEVLPYPTVSLLIMAQSRRFSLSAVTRTIQKAFQKCREFCGSKKQKYAGDFPFHYYKCVMV